jgi:hypothetical protein
MDWKLKVTYEKPESEDAIRKALLSYGFSIDERERLFKEQVIYAQAPKASVTELHMSALEKLLTDLPNVVITPQNTYRATQDF